MVIRALVSHYVTMDVDTVDVDEGCGIIRKTISEAMSDFSVSSIDVDDPEVLSIEPEERAYIAALEKRYSQI